MSTNDRSTRFWAIAERGLGIQNPFKRRHLRTVTEQAGLLPGDYVLDMACGQGGPALGLARDFGCSVVGIDYSSIFIRRARQRFVKAGMTERGRFICQDGRDGFDGPEDYKMSMCLGATFVLGGLEKTIHWLMARTQPEGCVLIGECFLESSTPPSLRAALSALPDSFMELDATVAKMKGCGMDLLATHVAVRNDWDRYASAVWTNVQQFVRVHPEDEDADYFLDRVQRMQADYVRWQREYLGWGLFLGRRSH